MDGLEVTKSQSQLVGKWKVWCAWCYVLVVRLGNGDVDGGDDNHHNLLFQDTRRDDQRCLVLHCHRFATPADNIYTYNVSSTSEFL